MKKLLISLVTWNGGKYMRYCLDSLIAQSFQDFDLVIFDNGSSDDTLEIARAYQDKFGDRLIIVDHKENSGFAKGHNQVIGLYSHEFILVLNQDLMLDKDYITNCLAKMEKGVEIGAVSGKLYTWDFPKATDENKGKTNIIDSLGLELESSLRVKEAKVGIVDNGQFSNDVEVFGVSGTAPIYRRKALVSVQYDGQIFDEDFFSYKEDVDLAYRLRSKGYTVWVVANAHAWHDRSAKSLEGATLKEELAYRKSKKSLINFHSYKNHLFLMVKNVPLGMLVRILPSVLFYEFKKIVYLIIFERTTFGAMKEFFKLLPKMKLKRAFIQRDAKRYQEVLLKWVTK